MADDARSMLGVGVDPSCEWCHGLGEQDEMDEIEGTVRPCPRCWAWTERMEEAVWT